MGGAMRERRRRHGEKVFVRGGRRVVEYVTAAASEERDAHFGAPQVVDDARVCRVIGLRVDVCVCVSSNCSVQFQSLIVASTFRFVCDVFFFCVVRGGSCV